MTTRIHRTAYCSARWRVTTKPLFTTALLLVLLQAAAHGAPLILPGRIVRVTDGDTVTLHYECQTLHKIRLAGIDARESAMPYGKHPTLYLVKLVFGKAVEAVTHKQDRYGRKVATLMLGGKDVNLAMIQAGLAWHYKQYEKEQPVAQAQAYARAEELARTKNLALWQDNDAHARWDWRKSRRTRPPQMGGTMIFDELAARAGTNP